MKIAFVLSKEFIELVRENLDRGYDYIIRIAERRYMFRNPKADMITVMNDDIDRAVDIINNDESKFDRYASVYTWLRNHADVVKSAMVNVVEVWQQYRSYITAKGLEYLWAKTRVYDAGVAVEKEFKEMVEEFCQA